MLNREGVWRKIGKQRTGITERGIERKSEWRRGEQGKKHGRESCLEKQHSVASSK